MDKAVNKILKKAKKAGRKLMRKLGIGKKDKKGKEDRSRKEMETDLLNAKKRAYGILMDPKNPPEAVKKKFPKIKSESDLAEIKLVNKGKGKYHVHLEINPKDDTNDVDKSSEERLPNQICSNEYLAEIQKLKTEAKNRVGGPNPKDALIN